jgi:hypothetical protein
VGCKGGLTEKGTQQGFSILGQRGRAVHPATGAIEAFKIHAVGHLAALAWPAHSTRGVSHYQMVAGFNLGDVASNLFYNPRSFMAENALGGNPQVTNKKIGMAYAYTHHPHQDFQNSDMTVTPFCVLDCIPIRKRLLPDGRLAFSCRECKYSI